MNTKVQPDTVPESSSGRAVVQGEPARGVQSCWNPDKSLCSAMSQLGELLSSALSRLRGRAEVSSRQTITYPVLTSREIHEGKQLEQLEGRTRQSRDFSFAFADRSRDNGKYPTIIWQEPQAQCSSLWDVASQKSSPPNAAQKRLAQPHSETQTLLQILEAETQECQTHKTLLQRQCQSQSNSGRFVDWNGNALTALIT